MDKKVGEEGVGAMYGERNMETYITICKIDIEWEFAVWLRELKLGLCNNLEGWDGEEGGRDIWEEGDVGKTMVYSCCLAETNRIL